MIVWKKWGLRIADCFFDEDVPDGGIHGVDLIRYLQWSYPIAGCVCTPFSTRLIDLRQPTDQLLGQIEADTRRQIRQSERKDAFVYCHSEGNNSTLLREVSELHDKFSALKSLPKANRTRLWAMWDARLLDVSLIRTPQGSPLVWQICYRDSRRVRGLYTGSFFRRMSTTAETHLIGRAHRFGRWKDILRLKNAGVETYDFGGWYMGILDQEKLRINAFKKRFGGSVEKSFNCLRGTTLPGKIVETLLRARQRMSAPESNSPEANNQIGAISNVHQRQATHRL